VRELDTLRTGGTPVRVAASTPLPAAADIALEVAATGGEDAGIRLSNDSGEEVVIGAGGSPLEVFVDRRRSRATPLANYPGRHAGPVRAVDGRVRLRVIVDRSMVEVFANDGETAVSDRLFPTQPFKRIEPVNGARLRKPAEMWPLRRVWRER
jgi:sucrose-6-phosphate hydrolase SacC (GH32 family)